MSRNALSDIKTSKYFDDLTEHQRSIVNSIVDSKEDISVLAGEAGTGKSFTINTMIKAMADKGLSVAVTSTTHKGVNVLSNMIGDATVSFEGTIHSFLNLILTYDRDRQKLKVNHKKNPNHADVLIVDEYSMLTAELLRYIEDANVKYKTILVGDMMQLLIDDSLKKKKMDVYELKQQMRQTSDSSLHNYLKRLRAEIENGGDPIPIESSDDIMVFTNHDEFLKTYRDLSEEKFIVCYTNNTVKTYNRNIIQKIHSKENEYNVNDLVVVTQPIGKSIKNRDLVKLLSVHEVEDYYEVSAHKVGRDYAGIEYFKIPKTTRYVNELLAPLAEAKKWSEYHKVKESFVSVHHVYAGTSHSYQGQTVKNIFVDIKDMNTAKDVDTLLRLVYVAMSRATHKAYIFKGDKRNFKALDGAS